MPLESGSAIGPYTVIAKLPALVDPSRARQTWAVWSWDERLVQPFVEGFEAALAIAGGREEQK